MTVKIQMFLSDCNESVSVVVLLQGGQWAHVSETICAYMAAYDSIN